MTDLEQLKQSAGQGEPEAQFQLGALYAEGAQDWLGKLHAESEKTKDEGTP